MGYPETPGCTNDNLLLKLVFLLSSESLRHLALLIASEMYVTCKLLEGQLNR
jgi:hypothetical protein